MAWWLGFQAFTAVAWIQSLVGELRFHKPCGVAKKKDSHLSGPWQCKSMMFKGQLYRRLKVNNLLFIFPLFTGLHFHLSIVTLSQIMRFHKIIKHTR